MDIDYYYIWIFHKLPLLGTKKTLSPFVAQGHVHTCDFKRDR